MVDWATLGEPPLMKDIGIPSLHPKTRHDLAQPAINRLRGSRTAKVTCRRASVSVNFLARVYHPQCSQ
jgi:hypothetical protein